MICGSVHAGDILCVGVGVGVGVHADNTMRFQTHFWCKSCTLLVVFHVWSFWACLATVIDCIDRTVAGSGQDLTKRSTKEDVIGSNIVGAIMRE